jgi:DNA processing protein
MTGDTRGYWLGFSLVKGIGPARVRALLDAFGDVEAAWNASREDLRSVGLNATLIDALIDARVHLDLHAELDRVDQAGFTLLTWEDPKYPERLLEIDAPPPALFVWGATEYEDRWAAAIVGTRKPTGYGTDVAHEVATTLARNGVTIVSGLARGVDSVAHRAAVEAGGRTLAVLGSGVDYIYPREHRRLAEKIAENGAVLSDYPLGTRPEPGNFPPRNRIISGLALVVVIVEAGESSGALITAEFAADQGREVFAVPGSIYSHASRGTNRLIQSGARPLLSADEVLEALNLDVLARQETVSEALPEDETERQLLQALAGEPLHVDELGVRCGLPVAQVSASLAMLELKGRVRQVGGMHYMRARESRAEYRVE